MRIKLKNHTEVVQAWATQSQPYGRCGNISFTGDTIFSYSWWPMARIVGDIVLYRDEQYSASTAKHQSLVRYACFKTNRPLLFVGVVGEQIEQVFEHNLDYFERKIARSIENEDQATIFKHYHHAATARYIIDMAEYIKRFCPYPDKSNHGWVVKCVAQDSTPPSYLDENSNAHSDLADAYVHKTRSGARCCKFNCDRVYKVRLNSKGRPVAIIGA